MRPRVRRSGPEAGQRRASRSWNPGTAVKKQILVTALKYVLGVCLLAWVVSAYWQPADGNPGLADALQREINPAPLLLAFAICLAGVQLTFVRWYLLVRAQGL